MSRNLLTFCMPDQLKTEYGKLSFGAEPPCRAGQVQSGPGFLIRGVIPDGEDFIVYGRGRGKNKQPQVWRARTRDLCVFEDVAMLFEVPQSNSSVYWAAGRLPEEVMENCFYSNATWVIHQPKGTLFMPGAVPWTEADGVSLTINTSIAGRTPSAWSGTTSSANL